MQHFAARLIGCLHAGHATSAPTNGVRITTGAVYCLRRLRHAHSGGPPHAEIMKAIRLFGERVLPYC